jgi:hypothetical protein
MDSKKTELAFEKVKLKRDMYNDCLQLEYMRDFFLDLHSMNDDPIPIKSQLRDLHNTVQHLHAIINRLTEKVDPDDFPDGITLDGLKLIIRQSEMEKLQQIESIVSKCSDNIKEFTMLLQSMHLLDEKGQQIVLAVLTKASLVQDEFDSLKYLLHQLCKCSTNEEMENILKKNGLNDCNTLVN